MEYKDETKEKAWVTIFIPEKYSKKTIKENPNKVAIDQLARVISHLEDRLIKIEKILLGSENIYPRAIKVVKT